MWSKKKSEAQVGSQQGSTWKISARRDLRPDGTEEKIKRN